MNEKKPERPTRTNLPLTLLSFLLLTFLFASAATASELVILYSNDIRGETEPCG